MGMLEENHLDFSTPLVNGLDFKSPRFFIWKAIQYVGVNRSGVKPDVSPNRQTKASEITCDIQFSPR